MEAWSRWNTGLGPSLADIGAPRGARTALADDGSSGAPGDLNGYSIAEADSLDATKALADKPPSALKGRDTSASMSVSLSRCRRSRCETKEGHGFGASLRCQAGSEAACFKVRLWVGHRPVTC